MNYRNRSERAGAATVELAAALPLLLFLLLGTWEVGRLLNAKMVLESAANVGGRQASAGTSTSAQVQQTVLNYLQCAGFPTASASVTVTDVTSPSADVISATQLDTLRVTVAMPFSAVRYVPARLVTNGNTKVTATATCYSAKADPYPPNSAVPNGW